MAEEYFAKGKMIVKKLVKERSLRNFIWPLFEVVTLLISSRFILNFNHFLLSLFPLVFNFTIFFTLSIPIIFTKSKTKTDLSKARNLTLAYQFSLLL